MGRIAPQRGGKLTASQIPNGNRANKVQKQRKKHKVVLETAGEKGDDDKLRVVLSFHAEPPPGYTFIPAGNTQLTAAMKDFAKRGGHKIMAVSATPHAARHELSREVHRIGYHFPTEVVAQVCSHYGIRLDSSGHLVGEQESEKLFMKISQKGQVVLNENVRDQVTINTEAKEIIRDLFPRIPDNDLFSIIKTAFQLGQNKVGTADEIPLVRRAQLSVVAHIRHTYTNYDRLLRQVNYNEARHAVEKETLVKLVEWRGDENDKSAESRKAVDDVVREVVVLSDEDETESELEEGQVVEDTDKRVKQIPKAKPPVLTTEHRPLSPADLSPDEEVSNGYRFVPQPQRRAAIARVQPDNIARQQSRYAVWDQVRQEYQSGVTVQRPLQGLTHVPLNESVAMRTLPANREPMFTHAQPVRYVVEEPQPVRIVRPASPPPVFRGADGKFYERLQPRFVEVPDVQRIYTPPVTQTQTSMPALTRARRSASPRDRRPQYHRRTPSMNNDGSIVESIESPDLYQDRGAVNSRMHRPSDVNARTQDNRNTLIDLTSSAEKASEPVFQHRRQLIELDDNIPPLRPVYTSEHPRQPMPSSQTQHISRSHIREYANESLHGYDPSRVQVTYAVPSERRVVYEPVPERQPARHAIRYVAEEPSAINYIDRNAQASRMNQSEQVYRQPPQAYSSDGSSRRVIVLDTGDPMEDVQRVGDPRAALHYYSHVRT